MSQPESLALNDHVICEILAHCEIETVLKFAQVSRHYCILASSKQLWIRLLARLQLADVIPAIPQAILDASDTPDLISQVKRIVLGPGSWSPWAPPAPTTGSDAPELGMELALSPKIPTAIRQHARFQVADSTDTEATRTQLLAGGRYLLVFFYPARVTKVAHLYNTATGRCFEEAPFGVRLDPVVMPSVDIPGGEDVAYVASANATDDSAQYSVTIHRVDLETGHTQELWKTTLPTEIVSLEWPELTLVGDILVITYGGVAFYSRERPKTLIINWATNKYAFVNVPKTDSLKIAVSPGYVYAIFRNAALDSHSLNIYALDTLRWRDIADSLATYESHSIELPFINSTPIISERFAVLDSFAALAVHKNPLRLDFLKILLYITPAPDAITTTRPTSLRRSIAAMLPSRRADVPAPTLISYHFNPTTREFARLSLAPAPRLDNADKDVRDLTYSGYASVSGGAIVDLQSGRMRQVGLSEPAVHNSSLTSHSSAIASIDTGTNEVEILQFL
ncbi:hypothetical protein MKEN_01470200 [Mycena kentingensis (nom. inval.)]|nr:hypothetical protein MKEN_01470200 [Mycena kentingensis (nom. inval.)]